MDLYGDEMLVNEVGDLRIRIYLGIQPSASASRRRGAEIEQYRPVLLLGLRQRGVGIFGPVHAHSDLHD